MRFSCLRFCGASVAFDPKRTSSQRFIRRFYVSVFRPDAGQHPPQTAIIIPVLRLGGAPMSVTLRFAVAGFAIALLQAPMVHAQTTTVSCKTDGGEIFIVDVDFANNVIIPDETQRRTPASITDRYITFTFVNRYGYNNTNRIDRKTGWLYVLVNNAWSRSQLHCDPAGRGF